MSGMRKQDDTWDRVGDPSHPDAYFQDFEDGVEKLRTKRDAFLRLERQLAALDDVAWRDLRDRAAAHLISRTRASGRGWQSLFDVFSEAQGYGYLAGIGCTAIHCILCTTGKTPDLGATQDGRPVFCEVKTINVSKDEAERRRRITSGAIEAGHVDVHVGEGFLKKLTATLEHAVGQLDAADPARHARRMMFTVLHFDDWIGDYQPEYIAQIDDYLLRSPVAGAELVFCVASNLFGRTFTMRSATVLAA